MADFSGTSGDNKFIGTADGDSFNMQGGGEDTVSGKAGNDNIFFDGGLDAGDHIDGGDGIQDSIFLGGDYSHGLVFTDTTLVNVENIVLRPGNSYDLTLAAGTAVDGTLLVQQDNLGVDDHVRIDASLFTAGHNLQVNVGQGGATVIGGAGDDSANASAGADTGAIVFSGNGGDDAVFLASAFTRADRIDGGDGSDSLSLGLAGDYVLTGKMLKNVETLTLGGGDFSLTMSDGNLANGHTLAVVAFGVTALSFDGSAERSGDYSVDGSFGSDTLIGGAGADTLHGNDGDDVLTGGKGADLLSGGVGDDTFAFTKLSDSGHHKLFDLIADLETSDTIDLSAIDANSTKAGNQAFHIVDHFGKHAGELVVSYDADTETTTVAGDVNGDGRADIAFHVATDWTGFTGWVL